MNIYQVTRKAPYYGSGSTRSMVVIADSEHDAARIHPDTDEDTDWEWIEREDAWVSWRSEEIYHPLPGQQKWPAPKDLNVTRLGEATAEWLPGLPIVILRDHER